MKLGLVSDFQRLSLADLLLPDRGLAVALLKQLVMASPLHDAALLHDADQIRIHNRAQPVGDHQPGVTRSKRSIASCTSRSL